MSDPSPATVHAGALRDLDAGTLYDLLRLRVDVFIVEQACPYPELDGRDLERDARHWWVEEGDGPVCYLRLLAERDGSSRIGRVATRREARGRGLAGALVRRVLSSGCARPVHVAAQSHLAGWYAGLGFAVTGAAYDEDGIPHLPMALP